MQSGHVQQNATPAAPWTEDLSHGQMTALEALVRGSTATQAAAEAEVDRTTLWRWMKAPTFAAAYNARKREMWASAEMRLLGLHSRAIDAVEGAIQGGNTGVALAVIRGMGLLSGGPPKFGSDCSERIRQEQTLTNEFRELLQ